MSKNTTLPVNTSNLVKYLEHSFSSSTTFLGEMMQNARRAKATKIDFTISENEDGSVDLVVTDDGVGVTKDSLLFTVAESGWGNCEQTKDVVESEDPFGMGFLSVLFACSHVSITSKDFFIAGYTGDILYKNKFSHGDSTDVQCGTEIMMQSVKSTRKHITDKLEYLCKGFPIVVCIDNKPLERPHALDGNEIDLGFGQMRVLSGWPNNINVGAYLQGLPVKFGDISAYYPDVVVHLDSKEFKARVPDREHLYNGADALRRVQQAYDREHFKHFKELSEEGNSYAFMSYYDQLSMNGDEYKRLFDTQPYLPKKVVKHVVGIPSMHNEDYDGWLAKGCEHINQSRFALGDVVLVYLNDRMDMEYNGALLETWMYLESNELSSSSAEAPCYLAYQGGLLSTHWVQNLAKKIYFDADDVECEVVPNNVTSTAQFSSNIIDVSVQFCEGYTIKVKFTGDLKEGEAAPEFREVYVKDTPVFDGQVYYVPSECTNWDACDALGQVNSFYSDNYDGYGSDVEEAQKDKFCNFVANNRNADPAEVLKSLLQNINFQSYPVLQGKKFVVTMSDRGNPTYTLVENTHG